MMKSKIEHLFNILPKRMEMFSPTKLGIRSDKGGDGHFGAPRSKIVSDGFAATKLIRYKHKGTDFMCKPGQDVILPVFARIVRIAYPYPDTQEYKGILIDAEWCKIKMFYLDPIESMIGKAFYPGEKIGIAQDISKRYPGQGVTPHVHLEITEVTLNPEDYLIDPAHYHF